MKKTGINLLLSGNTDAKYSLSVTNRFKKSFVTCVARGLNRRLLIDAVKILVNTGSLPPKYKAHPLKGYSVKQNEVVMECHIQPDWLLVWKQNDTELILLLTDTGTHSDLF